MEITDKMWEIAIDYVEEMREKASKLGFVGILYSRGCDELLERYDDGERTEELYNAMIDLR